MINLPKYWRKSTSLKTLDITCLKWFDKVYGNTYFACEVTVNYGMKNQINFNVPFTYGYGDHYFDVVCKKLQQHGITDKNLYRWQDQQDSNAVIRTNVYDDCKKRELMAIKGDY